MSKRWADAPSKDEKKLTAQLERLERKTKSIVPDLYSGIALALWDKLDSLGVAVEDRTVMIDSIFADSQWYWAQCVEKNKDISSVCKQITGFDIRTYE